MAFDLPAISLKQAGIRLAEHIRHPDQHVSTDDAESKQNTGRRLT
jgi:hypothetical protein